jgi:putative transposase
VLVAVGADEAGMKHVLRLAEGASENQYLFAIDGSKALRAAFRLPAKKGMVRIEKQAEWLEGAHPSAAASLREGLAEMFTVNRLGLSPSPSRCLVSTNVIESPHSGVRLRTRKVCRWRGGKMVLR